MKSLLLLLCGILTVPAIAQENFTQYVDPYIGSANHGHVFVGANVPFGAVQLGPTNIETGWDWCSGYNYSSNNIVGFAHTHLSGTGIGDLGDILVMPATGKNIIDKGSKNDFTKGYTSAFSHTNEMVKPGYYRVILDKYNIKAELTATERVGFHQYTFHDQNNPHLVIDLVEGIGWDAPTDAFIKKIDDKTIVGYRYSKGWANDQRIYFAMQFSQPLSALQLYKNNEPINDQDGQSAQLRAIVQFSHINKNILQVKVGISPVSYDNALLNIQKELPGWDFNATVKKADEKWNAELGKIQLKADARTLKVFYTSLYHTMIAPSVFNDVNGDMLGADKKIYTNQKFTNYTTFSLWDTYRSWHPLSTIIHPEKINDIVQTMLAIYKQQGKLPVWHLMGCETNTMVGYHAVPVIVDAYLKGYRGYDVNLAYEAVKQSAMQKTNGIEYIQKLQYIPADSLYESVSKALEYAIDDWCIAQMAKAMGNTSDYKYFTKRSKLYQLYFDKSTHFVRGRLANGSWRTPFNPLTSIHGKGDFVEGNAWQYTWLVPQDVEGLIHLFGGEKPFLQRLDSLFIIKGDMGAEASPDVSGLIGMYAQGNEPSHHIIYMYAVARQPWKTADLVRKINHDFFTDKTDGVCGNEDVGQMSAWYVFSALGFYPLNPANGDYVFGSPLMKEASILLPGNKKFNVHVINQSEENKYIQKVILNNHPYAKSYITHKDIMNGGNLVFYMGNKPSAFGTRMQDRPLTNIVY